ncbi:hypothetical protein FSARC_9627 [Fusarium sarcochroum]|uniref:Xylanolytic transcriptional activator regulatory domain-containing protein n=1 Tax=Fusarium sarcochroum TaxID=1208366 RepID=A0A8H4X628_9HYPO|nr:hypothetical protein FSARC_9627 [Fusarium sarcochroum]
MARPTDHGHNTKLGMSFNPCLEGIDHGSAPKHDAGHQGPMEDSLSNKACSDSKAYADDDPYEVLSYRICQFFYPPGMVVDPLDIGMIFAFTAEKVKVFLDHIAYPHILIPFIHHAALDINEIYVGLLAAICCTGACNLDGLAVHDVQEMLDSLAVAVQRDYEISSRDTHERGQSNDGYPTNIEKLQAVLLTCVLLLQFGSREQEKHIRQLQPTLAAHARRAGLVGLSKHSASSPSLHRIKIERNTFDGRSWTWESWIGQERKCRLVHSLILLDTLMRVKYGMQPLYDVSSRSLSLPCDDSAWYADTAEKCAAALGLNNDGAGREQGGSGTQNIERSEMSWVVKALSCPKHPIHPGNDNRFTKSILYYGVLVSSWQAQTERDSAGRWTEHRPPASDNHWRELPVAGVPSNAASQSFQLVVKTCFRQIYETLPGQSVVDDDTVSEQRMSCG